MLGFGLAQDLSSLSGFVFRCCLCEALLSDLFSQLKPSIDGLQNPDFSLQFQDSASPSLLPAVLVFPRRCFLSEFVSCALN
jgi:hypothetical protein